MSTNANEKGARTFKVKLTNSEQARLEREAAHAEIQPGEFIAKAAMEQLEVKAPRLWR